jgi:hypothetical protein
MSRDHSVTLHHEPSGVWIDVPLSALLYASWWLDHTWLCPLTAATLPA